MTEHKFGTWYPIESAPKDGTEILATNPQGWYMVCGWWNDDISQGWHVFDGCIYIADTFTHWMPLPPAPGGDGIKLP